jgi:hypothetical protein
VIQSYFDREYDVFKASWDLSWFNNLPYKLFSEGSAKKNSYLNITWIFIYPQQKLQKSLKDLYGQHVS